MSEEKFNELLDRFSKVKNPVERAKISYVALGRVAAGKENMEPGADEIKTPMGKIWLAAADRFERILKEDKNKAFSVALQLTLLPVSSDPKIEDINKWVRGDGPSMLGRDELRETFLDYLANKRKSDRLVKKLSEYISYDLSKIKDAGSAFKDPDCYLSLTAILLGMKLGMNSGLSENAKDIYWKSKTKKKDPNVSRVVRFYRKLPDTKWLAEELKLFKVK